MEFHFSILYFSILRSQTMNSKLVTIIFSITFSCFTQEKVEVYFDFDSVHKNPIARIYQHNASTDMFYTNVFTQINNPN